VVELIECCSKKCKWTGLQDELKKIRDQEFPEVEVFDRVCPKCLGKEFYALNGFVESEKVDQVNKLIQVLTKHRDKPFLRNKDVAHVRLTEKNQVYFFDETTRRKICISRKGRWFAFSSGALSKLVEQFPAYIKNGKAINVDALFSKERDHGFTEALQKEIKSLPCVLGS